MDRSKPHWGFECWNDFFIRKFKPWARPIDQRKNAIVNSSESDPYSELMCGVKINPSKKVYSKSNFWIKGKEYSLYDMFGAK